MLPLIDNRGGDVTPQALALLTSPHSPRSNDVGHNLPIFGKGQGVSERTPVLLAPTNVACQGGDEEENTTTGTAGRVRCRIENPDSFGRFKSKITMSARKSPSLMIWTAC